MQSTRPGVVYMRPTRTAREDDPPPSTLLLGGTPVGRCRTMHGPEGCNVEVTSTSFKSPRTGQVRREREQRERFNEGPMSLNVSSGTRCLDIGEQQSGNDRHRDKAFELCVGTESMAPLASNLSDRSCHALAEADGWPITDLTGGECPEPDSATVSWLARAVPRPCDGRFVLPGAADSLLPSRTRSPAISITGGRRHIVPVRIGSTGCGNDRAAQEIGERGREWSAVSSGRNGLRTRTGT